MKTRAFARSWRTSLAALGVLSATAAACGADETPADSSACVVVGCDCVSDDDCHPSLTCNVVIGLCGISSVGNQDTGTDAAADSGETDGGTTDTGSDTQVEDVPLSDVPPEVALSALERACTDACTTYTRCNDGGALCEERCGALSTIINESVGTDIERQCAGYWDQAATCLAGISQSCNSVTAFFETFEECSEAPRARPDCFGGDGGGEGSGEGSGGGI